MQHLLTEIMLALCVLSIQTLNLWCCCRTRDALDERQVDLEEKILCYMQLLEKLASEGLMTDSQIDMLDRVDAKVHCNRKRV